MIYLRKKSQKKHKKSAIRKRLLFIATGQFPFGPNSHIIRPRFAHRESREFMYYPFVRKALFQLDPERAHEFTFQQLRRITGTPFEALVRQKVPAKPVNCMGLTFKNPLGLAAGLDKDGECIDALGAMGFGSIEIGTVTPRPQPGNDKPRLFRLVDAEGLINRMGFNNLGVDNLVENVKKPIMTAFWVLTSAKIKIRRWSRVKMTI